MFRYVFRNRRVSARESNYRVSSSRRSHMPRRHTTARLIDNYLIGAPCRLPWHVSARKNGQLPLLASHHHLDALALFQLDALNIQATKPSFPSLITTNKRPAVTQPQLLSVDITRNATLRHTHQPTRSSLDSLPPRLESKKNGRANLYKTRDTCYCRIFSRFVICTLHRLCF